MALHTESPQDAFIHLATGAQLKSAGTQGGLCSKLRAEVEADSGPDLADHKLVVAPDASVQGTSTPNGGFKSSIIVGGGATASFDVQGPSDASPTEWEISLQRENGSWKVCAFRH